jgi:hypothetical protein
MKQPKTRLNHLDRARGLQGNRHRTRDLKRDPNRQPMKGTLAQAGRQAHPAKTSVNQRELVLNDRCVFHSENMFVANRP